PLSGTLHRKYYYSPLRKASTSARVGMVGLPPKRVHFSPAVAAAKRKHSVIGLPSARASAKAPWKMSPAARVSTATILNTGMDETLSPSLHSRSPGPLVAATNFLIR